MAKKIEALLVAFPSGEDNRDTVVGTSGNSPWEFALAEGKQAANLPTLGYGPLGVGNLDTSAVAAGREEPCSVRHVADWEKADSYSAQENIPFAGLAE